MKLDELKKDLVKVEQAAPVINVFNPALNMGLVRFPHTDDSASLQATLREMDEMSERNRKFLSGERYDPPPTVLVVDEAGGVIRMPRLMRKPDSHLGAVEL